MPPSQKIAKNAERFVSVLNRGASFFASVVLFMLMLLVSADVIGRYAFNTPVPGTFEIASVFLTIIIFLGIAYAQERKRHIFVDFFLSRLSERVKWPLVLAQLAMGAAVFGLLTLCTGKDSWTAVVERQAWWGLISVPIYPGKIAITVGCGLACIQFMLEIIRWISQGRPHT